MKTDLSIIIPAYNEEGSIRKLIDLIKNEVNKNDFGKVELLVIDDGSTDKTFKIADECLKKINITTTLISFKTNQGKSAALNLGFELANGSSVITLDADLQDDPREIKNFLNKLHNGFDLVSGWKFKRNDPLSKTLPSKIFNFITSKVTGIKLHDFNCGFKAYKHDLVKDLKIYGEMHRFIQCLAHSLGYKVSEIKITHKARKFGTSKFGVERYFRGFFDLLTVLFLNNYKYRPLHLFGSIGILFILFGFVIEMYLIYKWILGFQIGNRPLFFLGILMLIIGLQSFFFGLIGEMLVNKTKIKQKYLIKKNKI